MKVLQTTQFKKDLKKQIKRGKDKEKLFEFLEYLIRKTEIPAKYKDHQLRGNWSGRRDAHLEPDLLVVYQTTDEDIILERTGTHSDLF